MKNRNQCKNGLVYNHFAIIQIQTFTSQYIRIPESPVICRVREGNIDDQLFSHKEEIIDRYELKGFDIKVVIDQPEQAILEGHVHVWAAVFFDMTVELSYRIIVPPDGQINGTDFCHIDKAFNTNQLITIAGMVQHVEHWIYNKEKERQEIDGSLQSVQIRNFPLDKDSRNINNMEEKDLTFEEVMRRYRNFFDRTPAEEFRYIDHYYVYADVWETVAHDGYINFNAMKEDEIIQHIETCHRAELVGLMTLYPEEWPYRMEDSYDDICGKNVAIDTDDLVLVNQNMSVVFGTYGKRGEESPTDWIEHLGRRDRYHTSWPEFLVILEILLAKKQTINYVLNKYIHNSRQAASENIREMIEQNAWLSVQLSNIILQLDSVRYLRYMSHIHMYNATARNLRIQEDEKQLDATIKRVDKSLNNANNVMELKQASDTKFILLFISIASLFGVLLQGREVPVFSMISEEFGTTTAVILVSITSIGIAYGTVVLVKMLVKYLARLRKQKHQTHL